MSILSLDVTLRFKLSPILQALDVTINCNHPPRGSSIRYQRDRFYKLDWVVPSDCWYDDSERYADVAIHHAGAFQFTVEYKKFEKG